MSEKILNEKQIAEIETEIAARDDSTAMESACGEYNCSCHDRLPTLCQTVRVLRAEIAKLTTQWCQCGHTKDQHSFFSDHDECYECDQASSDLCCEWRPLARPEQLQSQLEQLGADVLVKARNDTVKYLESQLEQLRAENEKLKASRRVHELDNHHNALACGYCAGPIKDEITQLQSQLEQVTKERDNLYIELADAQKAAEKWYRERC